MVWAAWLIHFIHSPLAQAKDRSTSALVSPFRRPLLRDSIRFAVIGDYGELSTSAQAVANLVRSWDVDFILTLGDNNYPDGGADTIQHIEALYGEYVVSSLAKARRGRPRRFFPTLGNHDWNHGRRRDAQGKSIPGKKGNAEPYLDYFELPNGQGSERYYDFVRGDAHFFALDSDKREPDGTTVDSIQAQWLKRKLATSTAQFKIVYFHHAPYSSGRHFPGIKRLRWPFAEWGAALVLAGHDHMYERIERDGMIYLVNGLGGGEEIYELHESAVEGSVRRYVDDRGAIVAEANDRGLLLRFVNTKSELIDQVIISDELATPFHTIGHRGAAGYAPENTLPSFETAKDLGIYDVELDIQLSGDGHLVLFHDKRMDEKTQKAEEVHQFPLAELLQTDIGTWFDQTRRAAETPRYAGTMLISLEQLLATFGADFFYHIEIKGDHEDIPAKLVALLEKEKLVDQVIVTSKSEEQLTRVRTLRQDVALCYLLKKEDSNRDGIARASRSGFHQVGVKATALTPDLVRAARAAGLGIRGYGIETFADIDKVIRVGAEGTTIDWPDLLWTRILNHLNHQDCPIWKQRTAISLRRTRMPMYGAACPEQ
jgi:glycerophosphoryl diester phosphodiesterase